MFFPRFLSHGPLMDNDPAPGGGGDPAPQGGDPNPAGDPPQPPASVTLDALKDLLKTERQATLAEVTKQINGLDAKYQKQLKKQEPTPPNQQLTAEQLFEQKQREYEERIANIEREREQEKAASQQRELDAEIKSALADFPWQTDSKGASEGKDVAFTFYRSQAKRDDEGRLLIGDMPLAAYIKEHAARAFKAYHAPRNVGGAGATAGRGTVAGGLDMTELRRKTLSGEPLTPEQRTALRGDLIAAIRQG